MNISVATNLISAAENFRAGALANFVKTQLLAAGWTIAGSSDGATGGMDAIDRPSDLAGIAGTTNKWFVLQSPHAAVQDRIQLLFSGGLSSAAGNYICLQYNPDADYADNGLALPTSSYGAVVIDTQWMATSIDVRHHLVVDLDPPYGWALQGHTSLTPATKQGGAAFIPLGTQGPNSPGKPYVVLGIISGDHYTSATVSSTSVSTTASRGTAEPSNPPAVPLVSPGLVMRANGVTIMPGNADLDTQSQDVSSPIIFQDANNFFGVSDFIRWAGTPRNYLDLFQEGVAPMARVCFGQVTFPWDGTTIPLI